MVPSVWLALLGAGLTIGSSSVTITSAPGTANDVNETITWWRAGRGGHYITEIEPTDNEIRRQLQAECALWDSSCRGWNDTNALTDSPAYRRVFGHHGTRDILLRCSGPLGIDLDLPYWMWPRRIWEPQWSSIRSWMRTPECQSMMKEYPGGPPFVIVPPNNGPPPACCEDCALIAGNVEVFYWPEPGADSGCQSIITAHTIGYGATLSSTCYETLWRLHGLGLRRLHVDRCPDWLHRNRKR